MFAHFADIVGGQMRGWTSLRRALLPTVAIAFCLGVSCVVIHLWRSPPRVRLHGRATLSPFDLDNVPVQVYDLRRREDHRYTIHLRRSLQAGRKPAALGADLLRACEVPLEGVTSVEDGGYAIRVTVGRKAVLVPGKGFGWLEIVDVRSEHTLDLDARNALVDPWE